MRVLMVVAQENFRDEELVEPRAFFEKSNVQVEVASTALGRCTGVNGTTVEATVALEDAQAKRYDGVVFVGGPGASALFNDAAAKRLAVQASRLGKVVGAICVAPVILARAGLLGGKRATVFPSERDALMSAHALLQRSDVVTDGALITASGPRHCLPFANAVVAALEKRAPPAPPRPEPAAWVGHRAR